MESVFRRAYGLVRSVPPRVVLAAKLVFAILAIVIVAAMVDWRTVATDPHGLILPILAGLAVMVPALMVTALRWKLLIGTETPRRFSFLTALRGWCLGLFVNLVVPGVVGGDVARAHYASVRAQIKYPRSLLVVFTERLFGLLTICLLGAIGLLVNDHLERFTHSACGATRPCLAACLHDFASGRGAYSSVRPDTPSVVSITPAPLGRRSIVGLSACASLWSGCFGRYSARNSLARIATRIPCLGDFPHTRRNWGPRGDLDGASHSGGSSG